jgi:hypothetical protein
MLRCAPASGNRRKNSGEAARNVVRLSAGNELLMLHVWTPDLSDDERAAREAAEVLAAKQFGPRAEELDRTGQYPWDHVEALADPVCR